MKSPLGRDNSVFMGTEPTREFYLDSIDTVREGLKRRFRSSFFDFAVHCLGYDFLPHVHGDLCEALQLAYWGQGDHDVSGGIHRILALMPRGSFKTSLVTQAWPAWILTQNDPPDPFDPSYRPAWEPPRSFNGKKGYDQRILLGQEVDDNVAKFLGAIKELFQRSPMLLEIFGNLAPTDRRQNKNIKWTNDAINVSWRQDYRTKDFNVGTCSLTSAANSTHCDIVVADDIFGEKQVQSEAGLQSTVDFYRRLIPIADNPAIMVFVGTRWHDNDLYSYLMESDGEKGKWQVFQESVERSEEEIASGKDPVFFPERFTAEVIADKKSTMRPALWACNTGEAPILMADWTIKPLRDVVVGDQVVGFTIGTGKEKAKLCVSTVVANGSRVADVQKVTMEDGHEIRCTPDHKWYVGKHDDHRPTYASIGRLKKLCRVVSIPADPTAREFGDWRYLAGIVDGEGSVGYGSIQIFQSVEVNPHIAAHIEAVVARLGIKYTRWVGKSGTAQRQSAMLTLKGARDMKLRLNHFGDPAKKHKIAASILEKYPSGVIRSKVKVAKVEPDGVDAVYSMQTTSGNYVAWGYASKNCQYNNRPIDEATALFKPSYFTDSYYELPSQPALQEWLANKVILTTADPAISDKDDACDAVIITCAWDQNGHVWTLDLFAERGPSPGDYIDELFRQYTVWAPLQVGVEKDKLQKAIMFYANQQSQLTQVWPPFKDLATGGRSKDLRIAALEPLARAGRLHFRREHASIENELVRYPKARTNDRIDALAYQLDLAYMPFHREAVREETHVVGTTRYILPDEMAVAWRNHQIRLGIHKPDPYQSGTSGLSWKQL